ncbi:MAG: hypothetical protein GU359_04615 [Desulfurococcales archaeon]|jgi:ABC-2 type transport system permease protein|nr:hypothetical protein [Desulfurococcales archaeon]
MRRLIRELRAITVLGLFNGYIPVKNNPLWIISFTLGPVSYLFLLYMIGRENIVEYAFIGGLVLSMSASAYGLLGDIIWYRNSLKIQDMFIVTPNSIYTYALGIALSSYIWALPSLAIFIIIGFLMSILRNIYVLGVIIGLTTILWINTALFTLYISRFIRSEKYVWPLVSIISLGLSVFPPVYYPVTILPRDMWMIALIPPTASSALLIESFSGMIDVENFYILYSIFNLAVQTMALAILHKRSLVLSE